jgi:enterochelin esterase-like enzyme
VRVYVPSWAPARDRPVLFLFDGQNVFDDAPSFAGGWHAHEEVERLSKRVVPPVIVGIEHGEKHRLSELSPYPIQGHAGELDAMLAWMLGHLIPELTRQLSLTRDPARVVIGGSSMGGLASLYAALRHPDVFGGALSMSPSLFVGDHGLAKWAATHRLPRRARIYLDAGALEAGGKLLRSADQLAGILREGGVTDLLYRADPKGRHSEACWRRRLLPALRFHFGHAKDGGRASLAPPSLVVPSSVRG